MLVAVVGATVVTGRPRPRRRRRDDGRARCPQGLPSPAFPWTSVERPRALLAAAAVGIVLVSLTDTIATSTSFAARRGDEVDPNQEMIGIGAANVAAGLFQGFAVSASGSRTAVAEQVGREEPGHRPGRRRRSVVLLLVFFPALLKNLPQPALAAVVIAAALSLVDFASCASTGACARRRSCSRSWPRLGVILFGVLEGILIAVVLSILLFFRRSWWPQGEVLGYDGDLDGWHALDALPRGRGGRRGRGVPLGGATVLRQRGHLPPADPPLVAAAASRAGSSSSARRSPTST